MMCSRVWVFEQPLKTQKPAVFFCLFCFSKELHSLHQHVLFSATHDSFSDDLPVSVLRETVFSAKDVNKHEAAITHVAERP